MPATALAPDALHILEALPDGYIVLSPNLAILTANSAFLAMNEIDLSILIGKPVHQILLPSANGGATVFEDFLTKTVHSQQVQVLPTQAFLINKQARQWQLTSSPVANEQGELAYILLKITEIATLTISSNNNNAQVASITSRPGLESPAPDWLKTVLYQAAVGIGLYIGKDYIATLINPNLSKIIGRSEKDLLGKPILENLPKLKGQAYPEILDRVFNKGLVVDLKESPATFLHNGALVSGYFNIRYQPLISEEGQVIGIINTVVEVTSLVKARQKTEELNTKLNTRIAERKKELAQAQQQLLNERNTLSAILNQAPVAMALFAGQSLEIITANQSICGIWGRKPAQVLNKPLLQAMPELAGQGFDELLLKVLNTGEPFIGREVPAKMYRNGTLYTSYYNFVYQPLYNAEKNITGVVDIAIEVTELVNSRKAVEEREQELKLLNLKLEDRVAQRTKELSEAQKATEKQRQELNDVFMQAPVAIALYKGPGFIVELANPTLCTILNCSQQKILNNPIFNIIPEAANQGFKEKLTHVLVTGQTIIATETPEQIYCNGKTDIVYLNVVYNPLRNSKQEINGVIMVATEVTEQVLARQATEQSEKLFRTLLESMPQMTWTNLPTGEVNFYSDHWYNYTGLNYNELRNWGWEAIIHPQDLATAKEAYAKALETGEVFMVENRLRQATGEYRWHLNRAVAVRNNTDQITLWVGTSTDIHEKKMAEEAMQNATDRLAISNKELRSANKKISLTANELAISNQKLSYINADLDSFIYTASHDLRAPIINIEGLMTALRRNLPPEVKEMPSIIKVTDFIDRSVERFKRTINELTEITKLQRIGTEEDIAEINLISIIKDIQLDLATQIEQCQAKFYIQASDGHNLKFSAKNARSILYNLISNAIKYRHPNRAPIVNITCQAKGHYLVLTIADNGLGMDLSQENKIFAMFERLHNHVEGSGVGLYIVKKIIENAGGKIEVISEPNLGATFKVYFKQE